MGVVVAIKKKQNDHVAFRDGAPGRQSQRSTALSFFHEQNH
jgi:hypothetical protein